MQPFQGWGFGDDAYPGWRFAYPGLWYKTPLGFQSRAAAKDDKRSNGPCRPTKLLHPTRARFESSATVPWVLHPGSSRADGRARVSNMALCGESLQGYLRGSAAKPCRMPAIELIEVGYLARGPSRANQRDVN